MQSEATIPNVKWAQRKDKLYVTIDAVDVKNPEIDIVDGHILKFKGTDQTHTYAFEIELYDEVVKEESKFSFDGRNIFLNIQKKTKGPYWPRMTKNSQKLHWLQADWKHYIDEDEEEEENKPPQFGGNEYNFPGMGGMQGMEGMEGMAGMEGMGGDDDDDDMPDISAERREQFEEEMRKNKLNDLDAEENK